MLRGGWGRGKSVEGLRAHDVQVSCCGGEWCSAAIGRGGNRLVARRRSGVVGRVRTDVSRVSAGF